MAMTDEMTQTAPQTSTGRKIGYARVSTDDQDLALQLQALTADGCEEIHQDKASGKLATRPGLDEALAALQPGDVLVVWKLDRLGRSLRHLVDVVAELGERKVGFRSLHELIDTSNGAGRFMFHVFAALAEFERDMIRERTMAGLAVAAGKGHRSGRKHRLTPEQRQHARQMHEAGESVAAIARVLGVSRPVIYRALDRSPARSPQRATPEAGTARTPPAQPAAPASPEVPASAPRTPAAPRTAPEPGPGLASQQPQAQTLPEPDPDEPWTCPVPHDAAHFDPDAQMFRPCRCSYDGEDLT